MRHTGIRNRFLAAGIAPLSLAFALTGCSDSSDNNPPANANLPQADNPMVEGPVTEGGGDDSVSYTHLTLPTSDLV